MVIVLAESFSCRCFTYVSRPVMIHISCGELMIGREFLLMWKLENPRHKIYILRRTFQRNKTLCQIISFLWGKDEARATWDDDEATSDNILRHQHDNGEQSMDDVESFILFSWLCLRDFMELFFLLNHPNNSSYYTHLNNGTTRNMISIHWCAFKPPHRTTPNHIALWKPFRIQWEKNGME